MLSIAVIAVIAVIAALAGAVMRTTEKGMRREKVALPTGCKPRPATAPAGSNRSSYGGNEVAEAFVVSQASSFLSMRVLN